MINFLILYELFHKVYTMYGIYTKIKKDLTVFMTPSYGTIKPALKRLESLGYITSQKTLSKGGRPSVYYSITDSGRSALKEELLSQITDNPSQFLTNARVRLYCADILEPDELKTMIKILKNKTDSLKIDSESLLLKQEKIFHRRMIFDNLNLELKNFENLLEDFSRAGNS